MVQTRSSFKKNTTDTNVEVNRDVAEASNKNTMIQKKRKTTTQESTLTMVQTRSSFKKNTTDTNVEVNRDVAEESNKNTMIQKKRTQNSILKPIEASKKTTKKVVNARDAGISKNSKSKSVVDRCKGKVILRKTTKTSIALNAYLLECREEYIKNHPGETRLPEEENVAAQKKFFELVKTTNYYIVKKYIKKFKDEEAARIARNPRCVRYFLGFKF